MRRLCRRGGEELTVDALELELFIAVGRGERLLTERGHQQHPRDAQVGRQGLGGVQPQGAAEGVTHRDGEQQQRGGGLRTSSSIRLR